MPTSNITIIGIPKDVVTVADPLIIYRPEKVKGDRYIIDLQQPRPPKKQ